MPIEMAIGNQQRKMLNIMKAALTLHPILLVSFTLAPFSRSRAHISVLPAAAASDIGVTPPYEQIMGYGATYTHSIVFM
jgi:hypothetical protein